MSGATIDLVIDARGWQAALPDLSRVAAEALGMALDACGPAGGATAALLACDDRRIAGLNGRFRGTDRPTNVLSWPAFEVRPPLPGARPPPLPVPAGGGAPFLGDIAIALETCQKQAEVAEITLKNHARHLILHGCLHLLGYDHETEADAALMEGIESRLLTGAGYPDPYE